MNSPLKALILTAGLGTRLQPQTLKYAKPALPFLNQPILLNSLQNISFLQPTDIVFNLHHKPETIRSALSKLGPTIWGSRSSLARQGAHLYKPHIHFSDETRKILGSGGALLAAREYLQDTETILMANGDSMLFFKDPELLKKMFDEHVSESRAGRRIATLLTTKHPDVGVRMNGLKISSQSEIIDYSVREQGLEHFCGVFLFSNKIFNFLPHQKAPTKTFVGEEFHVFHDVLKPAQRHGEKAYVFSCPHILSYEIGNEKDYLQATSEALKVLALDQKAASIEKAIIKNSNEDVSSHLSIYCKAIEAFFTSSGSINYNYKFEAHSGSHLWLAPGAEFKGQLERHTYAVIGTNNSIDEQITLSGSVVIAPRALIQPVDVDEDHPVRPLRIENCVLATPTERRKLKPNSFMV